MHALGVLMWKHLKVRRRRYFHTACEVFSTVPFIILIFLLRRELTSIQESVHTVNENLKAVSGYIPVSVNVSDRYHQPINVFYTPDTPQTRQIMDLVGTKLNLKRKYADSQTKFHKSYLGVNDQLELMKYSKNMSDEEAIVIFEVPPDPANIEEPLQKLTYTIRMKSNFQTFSLYANDKEVSQHPEFGDIYSIFMGLQWAIDSSFIELLTKEPVTQSVTYQEIPAMNIEKTSAAAGPVGALLASCTIYSLVIVFAFLMSRLLEERSTGVQELIKMAGVSTNVMGMAHFVNALIPGVVYVVVITVLCKVTDVPLINKTNFVYIAVLLILEFVFVVSMAFACSYLVTSTNHAITLSFITYLVSGLPASLLHKSNSRLKLVVFLTGLMPHMPTYWFWAAVSKSENFGVGVSLSSKAEDCGSVLTAYFILVLQSCFFFLLSWYLERVRPGKYGIAKPWNFVCQRQFWWPQKVAPNALASEAEEDSGIMVRDPQYFEDVPKTKEVGIKIVNVTKEFGGIFGAKSRVLSNVSLDIFKGEITVLVGHNGAGKTTLMSIITGMYSATAGDVYVNGAHSTREQSLVHKQLGLCPQHNLFFNDLTLLEHVRFFTMLKGVAPKESVQSSLSMLDKLKLVDKANVFLTKLSGGMKRRAQLAFALAGDANVLVLDEPTSGLDVDARRELWDMLLTLRGERTVLITTHFMEEADALGDRVVALHAGTVRCHATPMYLKKAIGSGYRLTLLTAGVPQEPAITPVITRVIPDATVQGVTINSVAYALPAKDSANYPKMFNELESKRAELGVTSIGVGVTTLEEVFLLLLKDVDISMADDEIDSALPAPVYRKLTGPALRARQFCVLFKRQLQFTWSKKIVFFIMQVAIPIALFFGITKMCNNGPPAPRGPDVNARRLALGMYEDVPQAQAFYDVPEGAARVVRLIARAYPDVRFRAVADVPHEIFLRSVESEDQNNYLVGVSLNGTHGSFMFTTLVRHAAPVALNLLSNLILSQRLPEGPVERISTINEPLRAGDTWALALTGQEKYMSGVLLWCFLVPIVVLVVLLNNVTLPCKERLSGARHLHIMSGCPPALYWLATMVYHMLLHVILYVLPVIIAVLALEKDQTFDNARFLGTMFIILFIGGLAMCSFMYFISFLYDERKAGLILTVIIFLCGIITPLASIVKEMTEEPGAFAKTLSAVGHVFPPHSIVVATLKAGNVARLNALCRFNKDKCPTLPIEQEGFNPKTCCESPDSTVQSYLKFSEFTPLGPMVVLILQTLIYSTIVMLCQSGYLNALWDRIWNRNYVPLGTRFESPLIDAEKNYVDQAIKLPKDKITDTMLVHNLHKNYVGACGRKTNAVRGIDFSIKPGECFGLLGANGAGKSTTFKMLTAEEKPTRGRLFTDGHFLDEEKYNYLWSLGYCPQFFGLDDYMTGRQNLDLVLTLRGLNKEDMLKERESWIDVVGLQKYAGRAVSAYSGGLVRRLATATALAARRPLTLLDEPTSGVDAAARRRVWTALRRGLTHHTAVIITSHSMDEMEALCRRILVLREGRTRALGTAAELRAAHAQGHAARIKLRAQNESTDAQETNRLKAYMAENFNSTLKDEHKTMLHYHLNDTLPYSSLFTRMEALKKEFPIVEDYSVTETTLEEVFLSLVKPAPSAEPTPVATKKRASKKQK